MGEGQIDSKAYFALFDELCPGVPVHIETISGFNREFPYLKPEFWKAWPHMPARGVRALPGAREEGHAAADLHSRPRARIETKAEQAYQKGEIERSLTYCREKLGLG